MYEIHVEGGMIFMAPLTLIFLTILGFTAYALLCALQKKSVSWNVSEIIQQLGGLALAWGTFSTIIGFYFAFKDLSQMKDPLPLYVIMGGLKVGLITVLYGLIIFVIALLASIGLRVISKNYPSKTS